MLSECQLRLITLGFTVSKSRGSKSHVRCERPNLGRGILRTTSTVLPIEFLKRKLFRVREKFVR